MTSVPGQLESAIAMAVPEADEVVGPWRQRYDPSAALGVPAHVTLLYPFKPPQLITEAILADLASFFASRPGLDLEFAGLCAFPDVLYLATEPQGAVEGLIEALAARYPETPPYGGRFAHVVPHLTIAQPPDIDSLPAIAVDFCQANQGKLPIKALIKEALLLVQGDDGVYHLQATLHFSEP